MKLAKLLKLNQILIFAGLICLLEQKWWAVKAGVAAKSGPEQTPINSNAMLVLKKLVFKDLPSTEARNASLFFDISDP